MDNNVEMLDRYLPLGSIVLVKGNVKKLMIVARGVLTGNDSNKKIYNYGAVLYPEGLIDERLIFFNNSDIFKVVVGLLALLCGSVITYLHARKDEDMTLLVLSLFGFMGSLTAIGYCKQGIEKLLK